MGGRSREAERISNAFLLSSSLSFGQSPRRGKSLLWLFSAFPLLLPASSFSYRYGLSVKGPKKLLSYFLEKKNYILLYLEEAFSNHQRITRLRRDTTTCLLPTTKKRHLFLFPFFLSPDFHFENHHVKRSRKKSPLSSVLFSLSESS